MESMPPLELLEKTHQFPGPYMFKAIGRVENGFAARVVAAVREELGDSVDPPFKVRDRVAVVRICVFPRSTNGAPKVACWVHAMGRSRIDRFSTVSLIWTFLPFSFIRRSNPS